MTSDLARRRAFLAAALGFALLDTRGKPAPTKGRTENDSREEGHDGEEAPSATEGDQREP